MTDYPEVLRKLQEEVDRVCGVSRMPTIEDMDKLPYALAVMNEVSLLITLSSYVFRDGDHFSDAEMEASRARRHPSLSSPG